MTANDLTTPPLPLLVQGRPQVSFARDPSEGGRGWGGGGGGGQITSKGVGLLRSNLPLGDSLLRGAGYFVTLVRTTLERLQRYLRSTGTLIVSSEGTFT